MPSDDTTFAAQAAQYQVWAQMGFGDRLEQMRRFSGDLIGLARQTIRQEHPEATPKQLLSSDLVGALSPVLDVQGIVRVQRRGS